MKLRNCEYCGTEYDRALSQCPQCGKEAASKKGRATASDDRIPRWMWILICTVLGVAVLIGLAYFLYRMDYLDKRQTTPPPVIEQPVEVVPVVDPDACTGLELSRSVVIMEEPGSRVFLRAVPLPYGCPQPVSFSSSDETVAKVGTSGMITAVAEGEAEIYVTCGDVQEVCSVICEFPEPELPEEEPEEEMPEEETDPSAEEPTETEPETEPEAEQEPAPAAVPTLSSEDFTLFRPGEETTLTVKDAPDGAVITYVSSNPDVATVTDTGLVTAVGNGTATITVTVNGTAMTCIARCNLAATTENNGGAAAQPVGNYTISLSDATLFRSGETFTLSLTDEAKNKATGVSWASADTTVCTVNANGTVTATGKGTTTVSTIYGGKTYSCIVRCNF